MGNHEWHEQPGMAIDFMSGTEPTRVLYTSEELHQKIRPHIPGATPGTQAPKAYEHIPISTHYHGGRVCPLYSGCNKPGDSFTAQHRAPEGPSDPVQRGIDWRAVWSWVGVVVVIIVVAVFIGTCFTVLDDAIRGTQ